MTKAEEILSVEIVDDNDHTRVTCTKMLTRKLYLSMLSRRKPVCDRNLVAEEIAELYPFLSW